MAIMVAVVVGVIMAAVSVRVFGIVQERIRGEELQI